MGFFGASERLILTDPGEVPINQTVLQALPDPGAYFTNWIGTGNQGIINDGIDRLRSSNGQLALANFEAIPDPGTRQMTPFSILKRMLALEGEHGLELWALSDLSGRPARELKRTLKKVTHHQGYAAAASWVFLARPEPQGHRTLDLELLRELVTHGWDTALGYYSTRDVEKALRNL